MEVPPESGGGLSELVCRARFFFNDFIVQELSTTCQNNTDRNPPPPTCPMVPNVFPPPPTFFPGRSEANSDMCIYGRTSKDPARGPERGPSKIVFAWSRRPLPISGAPGRRTCLSHKGPLSALFSMHGRPPEDPRTEEGSGREFLSPLSGPIPNRVKTVGGERKGTRERAHVCV